MTYDTVHSRLKRERGKASSLECVQCGERARDWAYQHTSSDEKVDPRTGRVYSDDPRDYEPMCSKCHRQRDLLKQESVRSAAEANGKRVGGANAKRWLDDPEAAHAQRSKAGRIGIRVAHEKIRENPELREKHRSAAIANAEKARSGLAAAREEDPEFTARSVKNMIATYRASRYSRSCDQCGMITNPPGIVLHQRASGHEGITIVEEGS